MKSSQRTHEIHWEENSGCPAALPENFTLAGIKRGYIWRKAFLRRCRSITLVTHFQIFMAECLAARPITMMIWADNEMFMMRSSGLCVCTGTGSRSWFRTMNLQTAETIQTLTTMATGRQLDEKETCEVLHKYHSNLLFPPGSELQNRSIFRIFNDISPNWVIED